MIPDSLLQKLATLSAEDLALVEAFVDYFPSDELRCRLQLIDAARGEKGGAGPARSQSDGPEAHKSALIYKAMVELRRRR